MIATLQRNISHHNHCWAQHVAYVWPLHYTLIPCDMLVVVGSNLYIFKLEPTTPIMSQQLTLCTAAEPAVSGAVKTGLSYRNDTIICLFFYWQKILIVNLRIPGVIWRGGLHFAPNNTIIILPSDTRRTTSELLCRTLAANFWRQIRSLETKCFIFFTFYKL